MRVQEGPALCSKMTEERRPNGDLSTAGIKKETHEEEANANGSSSPRAINNSVSDNGNSISGGRLKFFKDGKFILELSHRKEGERQCWIPVPKKTFWPAVGTPKQECSTSLSVSDDNSSVQSSPWQRDHCWKQSAPVQHAGRGLEFAMVRWRGGGKWPRGRVVRRKRRRPFDPSPPDWTTGDKPAPHHHNTRPLGINAAIQSLWERVIRADPGIVSPRKRILREMERVTLEDQNTVKRQRARPSPDAPARPVSSHSITSILAREDEPSFLRNLLRSSPPYHSPQPPSFCHPHGFYSAPHYRGAPAVWSIPQFPVAARTSYPVPTYPPPSWGVPYHPREDCSSDVPLNLSKDAG